MMKGFFRSLGASGGAPKSDKKKGSGAGAQGEKREAFGEVSVVERVGMRIRIDPDTMLAKDDREPEK